MKFECLKSIDGFRIGHVYIGNTQVLETLHAPGFPIMAVGLILYDDNRDWRIIKKDDRKCFVPMED